MQGITNHHGVAIEPAAHLIGTYDEQRPGPLLICIGGMHGNEPAGVNALHVMFDMLRAEPKKNPNFCFFGRLLGIQGNRRAANSRRRFLVKDLNRQWTDNNIHRIKSSPWSQLDAEDRELLELTLLIEQEIAEYQPEKIVVLDLHTTTANGGIFSVATDDPESVRIGLELHAPVIKGMLNGIQGTTLHYFTKARFAADTVAICFESGQHQDQYSVHRAIAAITNCMRTIGCVRAEDVENRHDVLLIEYAKALPKLASLISVHAIQPEDTFAMLPGFQNFQFIKKGEVLAADQRGPIRSSSEGYLLMPLYQPQGEDGFFLVRKEDH